MSGTDLDVAVRVWAPADVSEQGSLTAPGKKLQEIAKELPDQPVEVLTRGDQIELKCGHSHFKLNGLPSEEFPTLPEVNFDEGWSVAGGHLQSLIQHTAFAVSTEESRPILNGVLWELRDGQMRMVATNGHRLARMGVPAGSSSAPSAAKISRSSSPERPTQSSRVKGRLSKSLCRRRISPGAIRFLIAKTEPCVASTSRNAMTRRPVYDGVFGCAGVLGVTDGSVFTIQLAP